MRKYIQLMTLCTVSLFMFSCSKSNEEGRFIPGDAALAVIVNGQSITEKLPWTEVKNNPLLQEAIADSAISATVKKILNDPNNTGINTKTNMVLFMKKDSTGAYLSFQGKISDKELFRTFNLEVNKGAKEEIKDGIHFVHKYPECVIWDNDRFVYTADAPDLNEFSALGQSFMDSTATSVSLQRDLAATCLKIFNLEKSASLGKNERFTDLVKETGDIHLWLNNEEMNKYSSSGNALSMLNLEKLFKGALTTAAIQFENGAIKVNSRSYAGEELAKIFKKYSGGELNKEMLNRIPGKEMMAVFALHFDPEGLRSLLKLINLDGLFNLGSASLGFTLDDFINANKGDILIGLSDLKLVPDTSLNEEGVARAPKPDFNFVFAAAVGNKAAFDKLIKSGEKAGATFLNSSGDLSDLQPAYQTDGKYFALGNSKKTVDAFFTGNSANTVSEKLAGASSGVYFNLQSLIRVMANEAKRDSSSQKIYEASLQLWDDVIVKGNANSKDYSEQTITINLRDKNTNSLRLLNQYGTIISKTMLDNERKRKQEILALDEAISNEGMVN